MNIDHHISNTYFGDVNWVEPKASSACQVLYKLAERLKVMNKKIALCLYTGIATDTGNFSYSSADAECHWVVSRLMKYGINPHKVYEYVHSACSLSDLQFINALVSRVQISSDGTIAWLVTRHWEEKSFDLTEIIFSIMRLLKQVEVFIMFKRIEAKKIRVNFRSRNYVDVNRIAKFFGGGGHKRASGTTVEEPLEAVEQNVISFVQKYTKKNVQK